MIQGYNKKDRKTNESSESTQISEKCLGMQHEIKKTTTITTNNGISIKCNKTNTHSHTHIK